MSIQSGLAASKLLIAGEPLNSEASMRACSGDTFSSAVRAVVAASSSRKCLVRAGSAEPLMAVAQTVFMTLRARRSIHIARNSPSPPTEGGEGWGEEVSFAHDRRLQ